jgi:transposase
LVALSGDFAALYCGMGCPSVPPEKLLRAMLLQAFYSVRSERQLMERIEFDLLFRWFVGIGMDDPVWDHSTFTKNRDRLLEGYIAAKFQAPVLSQPRVKRLLSSEHFSVDGTLIQTWAAMKSFKPKQPPGDSGGTAAGATHRPISMARNDPTRLTAARPTPMRNSIAKGRAWRRGSASSAMG